MGGCRSWHASARVSDVPVMDAPQLHRFLEEAFGGRRNYVVEEVRDDGIRMRQPYSDEQLRPGGTVSGPTLMQLADAAAYLAVLAQIGPVALAVTTSLHIDFLRKPAPVDTLADGTILKLGRRLAVIGVDLRSDGDDALVARAAVTYSIPPAR